MVGRAFSPLQKPEMGRDFSDKWILIKRVPEGARRVRIRPLRVTTSRARAMCINDELN